MSDKLAIRHQPAKRDVEHERNFWQWKYERREAECEELAGRLDDLLAACKTWREMFGNALPDPCDRALFEAIDKADLNDTEEKEGSDEPVSS